MEDINTSNADAVVKPSLPSSKGLIGKAFDRAAEVARRNAINSPKPVPSSTSNTPKLMKHNSKEGTAAGHSSTVEYFRDEYYNEIKTDDK